MARIYQLHQIKKFKIFSFSPHLSPRKKNPHGKQRQRVRDAFRQAQNKGARVGI